MKHGEARFLSCMYVLSLTLLAVFAFRGLHQTAATSAEVGNYHLIILDAGHGGADGGATAPDGTRESDLNLAITQRLDGILGLLGEEVILVRNSDTDLADADARSISQKKVSDIRNRVALVNSHPQGMLLSIHCNSFPEEKYYGAQFFYGDTGNAEILAHQLQTNIQQIDPDNRRECKSVPREVYLFRHIQNPGILVECGFLTNSRDLGILKSEAYQKKLAVTLAVTTVNYLEASDSQV